MPNENRGLSQRFFANVEVKLILAWLLVVAGTIALDPGRTYLHNPGSAAELIIRNTVFLGFFALGSAVIIISGGIDLSSGSVIAMSATVFSSLLMLLDPEAFREGQIPTWVVVVSIAGTLLAGAMVGTLNAWLITCVGLPPFIATLATMVGLRSFGRGMILAVTGNRSQIDFSDSGLREILKNVTSVSIFFLIFAACIWFLMSRTIIGRHLHAMGGNEQAAKLSGIRTDRLKWLAYVIGSVSASIVGIVYFADQGSAKPDILARGYELNAIAASVIGGCSLTGGVGTIPGTVLGCLFLRTVIDAVNKIVGTGADVYEGMIVGIVVVLAVTFSQRESSLLRRRFFSSAIGWTAVPILSLIAGVSFVLFFREKPWFATWQPLTFGLAIAALLTTRAVLEPRRRK
ncbi:MAG: ABC transporter permease [Planctomycetales bacterium]|nr:ABC transporter permease [Planctomycetales bacterium]